MPRLVTEELLLKVYQDAVDELEQIARYGVVIVQPNCPVMTLNPPLEAPDAAHPPPSR